MTLAEFRLSRFCVPLVLPDEEQPQDVNVWRKLQHEDAERQYNLWRTRNGVSEDVETDEERKVKEQLDRLTKKNLPVPVLAENREIVSPQREPEQARESTNINNPDKRSSLQDSRGGQNPQQKWRAKNRESLNEYMRQWRAKQKLKKAKEK